MSKKIFTIIILSALLLISFIWVGYNPTLEKAINRYNSSGEVIDIFKAPKDKVVVYKYRSNDGEKTLVINKYQKQSGHYKIEEGNSLAIGLSNTNLTEFLTNYFFTHSETGLKYLYGIINEPQNVKEIRVTYEVPQDKKSNSKKVEVRSSVKNRMFLVEIAHEKNKNWLFSFYDENGNLIKETPEFAY
ncbi:hypothetical protein EU245_12240 [Lentibacillus lipolyticus]|nr:hypothetical protein EU245_12240 [Lentibacillus lipolyticus]